MALRTTLRKVGLPYVFTLTVAAILPGFQALLPVLLAIGAASSAGSPQLHLVWASTVGLACVNLAAFPANYAMEKFGHFSVLVAGVISAVAGVAAMAFGPISWPITWFVAFALQGTSVGMVYMAVMPLVYACENPDTLVAIFVALLDGSAGVYLGIHGLYSLGYSWHTITIPYAACAFVLGAACVFASRSQYPEAPPAGKLAPYATLFLNRSTPLLLLWTTLYVSSKYFYMATFHKQMEWIVGSGPGSADHVDTLVLVFSIVLPLVVVFTLVTIPMSQRLSLGAQIVVLGCLTCLLAFSSVATWLPWGFQFLSIFLLAFTRYLFFAMLVPVCADMFGAGNIGRALGVIVPLCGFSTLIDLFFEWLAFDVFDGSFLVVNATLMGLTGVVGIIFGFTRIKSPGLIASLVPDPEKSALLVQNNEV